MIQKCECVFYFSGVFLVDDDMIISSGDIDFAFNTWKVSNVNHTEWGLGPPLAWSPGAEKTKGGVSTRSRAEELWRSAGSA